MATEEQSQDDAAETAAHAADALRTEVFALRNTTLWGAIRLLHSSFGLRLANAKDHAMRLGREHPETHLGRMVAEHDRIVGASAAEKRARRAALYAEGPNDPIGL